MIIRILSLIALILIIVFFVKRKPANSDLEVNYQEILSHNVFGNLIFDGDFWKREIEITLFERKLQTELIIVGESDGEFDSLQIEAFKDFQKNLIDILNSSEEELYSHYKNNLDEYREQYGDEADQLSPLVSSKKDFARLLTIESIYVPHSFSEDEKELGILFNSSYEIEHGIAVKIVNGIVTEVGFQDIVL